MDGRWSAGRGDAGNREATRVGVATQSGPPGRQSLLHPCHGGLAISRQGGGVRRTAARPDAGGRASGGHVSAHHTARRATRGGTRRGVAADQAYWRATAAPDYYLMYLAHNYSFLAYSAAMEGRKAETLAAVQDVLQSIPLDMMIAMGDPDWSLNQTDA